MRFFALLLGLLVLQNPAATAASLLVKPYLQMGNVPSDPKRMEILWHAEDVDADWAVEYRRGSGKWKKADKPAGRRIAMPSIEPHRVYKVQLTSLKPGRNFEYRVLEGGKPVFTSTAKARKSARQPYRMGIFGDIAQDTTHQRMVASEMAKINADMVFVTGDIVYSRGRISEYRHHYFNCYNADQMSAQTGAALIRSTMFVAAPGNHDIATSDLEKYPDAMAYFYYWSQPLNGPALQPGGPGTLKLTGPPANLQALKNAAGDQYPRMANFSFDYGNAHWTVLDADPYVDWSNAELREWLKRDLASAQKATWRFVGFHHPGFNSSVAHFKEQQMRKVSDIFEEGKVDIVFSGHVHNYQRSFPMAYKVATGEWTLDKVFDGKTRTRPNGVIYIVTGAGGAGLYNPEQQDKPESWQGFTDKFISKVNSLTQVDVKGKRLELRQLSETGTELDRMVITK